MPFLPRPAPEGADPAADAFRQGNIDPLCLSLSRQLVVARCGGWVDEGGYVSDFLKLRREFRRAHSVVRFDGLVGVYDAGRGLDESGQNQRQLRLGAQGRESFRSFLLFFFILAQSLRSCACKARNLCSRLRHLRSEENI